MNRTDSGATCQGEITSDRAMEKSSASRASLSLYRTSKIGAPFMVTTGRQLREAGWPPGTDTAVVMLDGHCAFQGLPGEAYDIWWGAFLGMPQQLLIHGRLAEVAQRIVETRAQARAEHGWIMDIYLLRRR